MDDDGPAIMFSKHCTELRYVSRPLGQDQSILSVQLLLSAQLLIRGPLAHTSI